MSCDHAVWFPSRRLSDEAAGELYMHLCEGDVAGLVANPAIDAFYEELTRLHPQIDDVAEDRLEEEDGSPSVEHCVRPLAGAPHHVLRLVEGGLRQWPAAHAGAQAWAGA